jgi:hypothetical protein
MPDFFNGFLHYYGLDWIVLASGLWGTYLIGLKSRWAFAVWMVTCISGLALAAMTTQYGMLVYNVLLCGLYVRGFLTWGRVPATAAAPRQ